MTRPAAAAEALQNAQPDQDERVRREAQPGRGQDEQRRAEQQRPAPAEPIAERADQQLAGAEADQARR